MGNCMSMEEFKKGDSREEIEAKLKDMFSMCQGFVNADNEDEFLFEDEDEEGNSIMYPSAFKCAFDCFFKDKLEPLSFEQIKEGINYIGGFLKDFNDEEFSDFLCVNITHEDIMTVSISFVVHEI